MAYILRRCLLLIWISGLVIVLGFELPGPELPRVDLDSTAEPMDSNTHPVENRKFDLGNSDDVTKPNVGFNEEKSIPQLSEEELKHLRKLEEEQAYFRRVEKEWDDVKKFEEEQERKLEKEFQDFSDFIHELEFLEIFEEEEFQIIAKEHGLPLSSWNFEDEHYDKLEKIFRECSNEYAKKFKHMNDKNKSPFSWYCQIVSCLRLGPGNLPPFKLPVPELEEEQAYFRRVEKELDDVKKFEEEQERKLEKELETEDFGKSEKEWKSWSSDEMHVLLLYFIEFLEISEAEEFRIIANVHGLPLSFWDFEEEHYHEFEKIFRECANEYAKKIMHLNDKNKNPFSLYCEIFSCLHLKPDNLPPFKLPIPELPQVDSDFKTLSFSEALTTPAFNGAGSSTLSLRPELSIPNHLQSTSTATTPISRTESITVNSDSVTEKTISSILHAATNKSLDEIIKGVNPMIVSASTDIASPAFQAVLNKSFDETNKDITHTIVLAPTDNDSSILYEASNKSFGEATKDVNATTGLASTDNDSLVLHVESNKSVGERIKDVNPTIVTPPTDNYSSVLYVGSNELVDITSKYADPTVVATTDDTNSSILRVASNKSVHKTLKGANSTVVSATSATNSSALREVSNKLIDGTVESINSTAIPTIYNASSSEYVNGTLLTDHVHTSEMLTAKIMEILLVLAFIEGIVLSIYILIIKNKSSQDNEIPLLLTDYE